MRAVITVRSMLQSKPGSVKFESACGKRWNCNVPDIMNEFSAGERYYIDYNESSFDSNGKTITMKWVNKARPWKPEDGPNTWPDKEPYQGGGAKHMAKDHYDPEVGKRQTSANVAGNICVKLLDGVKEGERLDAFVTYFPTVADTVFKWLDSKGDVPAVSPAGSTPSSGGFDDDDIPFG